MAKQKIVLRVCMEGAKMRSKALKIAVALPGVISAALEGDRIVVVGDGIDAIILTVMLRKRMGFAELVSVTPVGEKREEKKMEGGGAKGGQAAAWTYQPAPAWPYQSSMAQPVLVRDNYYDPSCCIM